MRFNKLELTSVIKDFIDDIYVLCLIENMEYIGLNFLWKKTCSLFSHKVSFLDKVGKFNQSFAEWQTSGWSLISAQINVVNRRTFSLQHVVHCIKLFTSAHLHTLHTHKCTYTHAVKH